MNVINESPKLCSGDELGALRYAQSQFARWVSSHEIHVLFGALRHPTKTKSFLFSVCDMDFASWNDFAADSMLFAVIMKAVWLRCLKGTPCFEAGGSGDEDRKMLWQEITKESSDANEDLADFKDFFVSTHYVPVSSPLKIVQSFAYPL